MKIFDNKRGYSTGFAWIFGIVSIFGLVILFSTFNHVFLSYLVPTIKQQITTNNVDAATQAEAIAGIDRYIIYFKIIPYILFFVIVAYMIVAAVRKERETEFQ
jgi:lipopolysaccharide export LptBFGC system permease protein LptF